MTEEELTQMAILKAKALANETPKNIKIEKSTNEVVSEPVVEATPEVINIETGTPIVEYSHSITFGIDKEIKFNNWTGRTKKIFKKIAEDDSANLDGALDVLIRNYINNKDIYLSDVEQQYLILKLREVSLSDKFQYDSECPECGEIQTIESTIQETFRLKPANYPKYNEILKLTFVDIKNQDDLEDKIKEIQNAQDYDGITTRGDIEVAMHIKTNDSKSPQEILDMFDEMDLKSLNEILDELSNCAPSFESYNERVCKGCSKTVKFYTDEIPDVFSELL